MESTLLGISAAFGLVASALGAQAEAIPLLGAVAVVGLSSGVLGALLVLSLSARRQQQPRLANRSRPEATEELAPSFDDSDDEQTTKAAAPLRRARERSINRQLELSDRELRQHVALLGKKMERIEAAGLLRGTPLDDEGDWKGFDALGASPGCDGDDNGASDPPTSPNSSPNVSPVYPRSAMGSAARPRLARWAQGLIEPADASGGAEAGGAGGEPWRSSEPCPLVVFTDLGGAQRDAGDQVALFFLRGLETLGMCRGRAVILSGEGPSARAAQALEVVESLGFESGVALGLGECGVSPDELPAGAGAGPGGAGPGVRVMSASAAFHSVADDPAVAEYSLVVCCLCAPTDLAQILKLRGEAVARKLKCVAMLGSVLEARRGIGAFSGAAYVGDEAYLQPDPASPQYAADAKATSYVYRRLQDLGVPLVVVGRHAVYKAAVSAALYDELARTNFGAAKRLKPSQRRSIEELWQRVQAPVGSSERGGMPARCDVTWFAQVFCGGVAPPPGASAWDWIVSFNMYDCMAITAAIPELRYRLWSHDAEHEYDAGVAIHSVFGQSEHLAGVRHARELRQLILSASLAGISSRVAPQPMVIFTDPGQDLDDELAMIVLRSLVARGYVRPIGLVANLQPAAGRALLLKGTLATLGLADVPVAIGTDGGRSDHVDNFSSTASSYLAAEADVEPDAEAMLRRVLEAEDDASVLCLCISSLKDADAFLVANEKLFVRKVHSVTIMGGVEISDEDLVQVATGDEPHACKLPAKPSAVVSGSAPPVPPVGMDPLTTAPAARSSPHFVRHAPSPPLAQFPYGVGGSADTVFYQSSARLLEPDTSNNNTFDFPAAKSFYRRVQQLHIPLNVLTRYAAYGCPMPRKIYDKMSTTASPIAARLFQVQRKSIEELWKRANAAGEARRGLPARCDKAWYCKTFLKGAGHERSGDDSIWDLVSQLQMYDVLALLYAVPHLAWRFFDPIPLGVNQERGGEAARIVGLSPSRTGIKCPEDLRQFVIDGLLDGLRLSLIK